MVTSGETLAITHVTLIDGTGAPPSRDTTAIFQGGRVRWVGPAAAAPPVTGAEIDGRGKWLIPGLADVHVHVSLSSGAPALRHWLAWGVTTVRDLGGDPATVLSLRDRERRGEIVGARVVAHGPFLDGDPPILGRRAPETVTEAEAPEGWERIGRRVEIEFYLAMHDLIAGDAGAAERRLRRARELGIPRFGHTPRPY